jgi:cytochrome c
MKSATALLVCAALPSLAVAGAPEDFASGYALAQERGCLECHALTYRDAGPSFPAIAHRYRYDPLARERLPQVIRGGSAGHWGERFIMWPQPRLNDAEVQVLIDWVLSQ